VRDIIYTRRLPTVISVFAAKALVIQVNPTHFLYPKVNHFMNQGPKWDMDKVPLLHKILLDEPEQDGLFFLEVEWLLDILVEGLRSTEVSRLQVFIIWRSTEDVFRIWRSTGYAMYSSIYYHSLLLLSSIHLSARR
jgi:hypothetical protein